MEMDQEKTTPDGKLPASRCCDFCEERRLEHVYTPVRSARGMEVYLCDRCGLVQSISTAVYPSRPMGSMSSDADRSSYRYTKDVISARYEAFFSQPADFSRVERVLDVGSNRGAFIQYMQDRWPGRSITAVEPDASVTGAYADLPNVDLKACRFEHAILPENFFDFSYCAHTLEHSASARGMLLGIRRALKLGGTLFLAVPNLVFHADVIEEVFIDPHTFHFKHALLRDFATSMGFDVAAAGGPKDADVVLLLRKNSAGGSKRTFCPADAKLPDAVRREIVDYRRTLVANRAALKHVVARIHEAAAVRKVVIWGGGRIFDALVRYGGLEPACLYRVVDKYLYRYEDRLHGLKLESPDALKAEDPGSILVYIASRDYADEIQAEAGRMGLSQFMKYGQESVPSPIWGTNQKEDR
jgi:SAM-dependent methyltransferase